MWRNCVKYYEIQRVDKTLLSNNGASIFLHLLSTIFKYILFFVHCFHGTFPYLLKCYHIMFIIIVFWFVIVIGSRDSFFFVPDLLLTFFFCFFVLFHFCCSHARVFGKALVHEYLISCGHTEWYLLFSRSEIVLTLAEALPIKIWSN